LLSPSKAGFAPEFTHRFHDFLAGGRGSDLVHYATWREGGVFCGMVPCAFRHSSNENSAGLWNNHSMLNRNPQDALARLLRTDDPAVQVLRVDSLFEMALRALRLREDLSDEERVVAIESIREQGKSIGWVLGKRGG
jgi:hypothetical protein